MQMNLLFLFCVGIIMPMQKNALGEEMLSEEGSNSLMLLNVDGSSVNCGKVCVLSSALVKKNRKFPDNLFLFNASKLEEIHKFPYAYSENGYANPYTSEELLNIIVDFWKMKKGKSFLGTCKQQKESFTGCLLHIGKRGYFSESIFTYTTKENSCWTYRMLHWLRISDIVDIFRNASKPSIAKPMIDDYMKRFYYSTNWELSIAVFVQEIIEFENVISTTNMYLLQALNYVHSYICGIIREKLPRKDLNNAELLLYKSLKINGIEVRSMESMVYLYSLIPNNQTVKVSIELYNQKDKNVNGKDDRATHTIDIVTEYMKPCDRLLRRVNESHFLILSDKCSTPHVIRQTNLIKVISSGGIESVLYLDMNGNWNQGYFVYKNVYYEKRIRKEMNVSINEYRKYVEQDALTIGEEYIYVNVLKFSMRLLIPTIINQAIVEDEYSMHEFAEYSNIKCVEMSNSLAWSNETRKCNKSIKLLSHFLLLSLWKFSIDREYMNKLSNMIMSKSICELHASMEYVSKILSGKLSKTLQEVFGIISKSSCKRSILEELLQYVNSKISKSISEFRFVNGTILSLRRVDMSGKYPRFESYFQLGSRHVSKYTIQGNKIYCFDKKNENCYVKN